MGGVDLQLPSWILEIETEAKEEPWSKYQQVDVLLSLLNSACDWRIGTYPVANLH